jgi:type II secretory pathway pseudopilin PulG
VAGVVRIVLGVLFLLGGLFFLLTILGFLFGIVGIVIGIVLIASGASARGDTRRIELQQQQTNLLLQHQMQLSAIHANRMPYPPSYPPPPTYGPPPSAPPPQPTSSPPTATAERYCPACGMGNTRVAGFCQKCGKPLPPPP